MAEAIDDLCVVQPCREPGSGGLQALDGPLARRRMRTKAGNRFPHHSGFTPEVLPASRHAAPGLKNLLSRVGKAGESGVAPTGIDAPRRLGGRKHFRGLDELPLLEQPEAGFKEHRSDELAVPCDQSVVRVSGDQVTDDLYRLVGAIEEQPRVSGVEELPRFIDL